MEWWEKLLQNGIIGIVSIFGIKEGFPLLKFIIADCIMHSHANNHAYPNLHNDILRKLDNLIDQQSKNLSVISNNHTETYRLMLEKNYKIDDILTILNKTEMSLQQISLDLRLQQELVRKQHESVAESKPQTPSAPSETPLDTKG
jgi:hypothetical protein